MKETMRYPILVTALAVSLLAPTAAHAEEPVQAITPVEGPVQAITPVADIYYEANTHGEVVAGKVYWTANGVPFAKTESGKIIIGDGTDSAHTNSWIPWTDRIEYLAPYTSTVVLATHLNANYMRGAIAHKYLETGGEIRWGRAVNAEHTLYNGAHAGAIPVQVQDTGKAQFQWTKSYGAHSLHGAIKTKYGQLGGLRHLGAAVTDETTVWVHGVEYQQQQFERGTLRWSKATGAFLA